MTTEAVLYLVPEFLLIAVATVIYLVGAFLPARSGKSRRVGNWLALAGLVAAGFALWRQYDGRFWSPGAREPLLAIEMSGPLAADLLSQYVRWLTLAVGVMLVLLGWSTARGVLGAEYLGTLIMGLAGAMLVASARDLVLLFLGLELVSIPTYVLLYIGRRDAASQESAVKYFFLSILSSALLLYGFSFLYGIAGSTDLTVLRETLSRSADELGGGRLLALVALVLLFAGLGFRITAVPFHFYAPDVYQGTTNGNAGLLSVLPKIVGFVAIVRIVSVAMPGLEVFCWRIALILSVLTMTLGNVLALWQDNIRRLLAYSSIAHAGYMLIGVTVGFAAMHESTGAAAFDGLGAMLFYLVVYAVATTGTFAALTYLGSADQQVSEVDELAGLGRTHPTTALALAVFMFSLAGIPPLAGFWGKFTLFSGAVQNALGIDAATAQPSAMALRNWLLALAILGALNAAIAAAYYLRIIAVMYFRTHVAVLKGQGGGGAALAMLLGALLTVGMGLYPAPLVSGSSAASRSAYALPTKTAASTAMAQVEASAP